MQVENTEKEFLKFFGFNSDNPFTMKKGIFVTLIPNFFFVFSEAVRLKETYYYIICIGVLFALAFLGVLLWFEHTNKEKKKIRETQEIVKKELKRGQYLKTITLTQTEYNNLKEKDKDTLYLITH